MITLNEPISVKNEKGILTGDTASFFVTIDFRHLPLEGVSECSLRGFKNKAFYEENGIDSFNTKQTYTFHRKTNEENEVISEPKSISECESLIVAEIGGEIE